MIDKKRLERMVKDFVTGKNGDAWFKYFVNNGVKVRDNIVTVKGVPVFKIKHNYSKRKINLCYPEITPTLIPIE